MDLKQKIKVSQSLLCKEKDGEILLVDTNMDTYFTLDSVGFDIFQLLQEERTLQESFDLLLEMYKVEPEVLREDMITFIEKLVELELVSKEKN